MFGFEIFWRQNIGKKVVRKMLMKLTANYTIWLKFGLCQVSINFKA